MLLALLLSAASPDVDALFQAVDRPDTPGCAVDVRRAGHPLVQRAYGMADLEAGRPNQADTVFEAGSVSKQFTAALVARLAERGALSYDDSIRRWLPELPALYQPVTLAMLLHHTSGIRDWGALAELSGWPRGTRAWSMDDALSLLARQTALNFAPGTEYLYSNSNYVLAARIAERAGGRPFGELAQAELFVPLGLAHTRWRTDFRDLVPHRAQAYSTGDTGRWQLDMPFEDVVGPGGLLTTVGDLQRWNAALADPANAWAARLVEPGRLADGTLVPYGLGLDLGPVDGRPAISHAGSTAGYRAWLGRFPQDHLSVALLCNAGSLNTEELGPAVAARFLPAPAAPVPASPGAGVPAGIVGTYRNAAHDGAVRVSEADGWLRIGEGRFGRIGADTFATEDGRRALIRRDGAGAIVAIEVTRIGNAPVRLEAASSWSPDASALAAMAGRYRSADIEGEQRLAVQNGALAWIDPRGIAHPLRPTLADTFSAPDTGWTLRVQRDARGAVVGFAASIARARRIVFARQVE
ncbi:serine hydrolase [Stenotrophomonas sp. HITSZ_GD]|uniref:serine hydrolase n=1 Tax=Stenotrophomonas sp. HITSZ_GD TaxID=3037248 RepID=UPI00240DC637|nr:serine hydrolase [Stenotrophomonas sp. HITSZ_GD]MDG2526604.1 serine hydrolase [Stenotrophomonas sp. HITSZ_GD]